jgi:hypothetical protein
VICAARPFATRLVVAAVAVHAALWAGPALDEDAAAWLLFAMLLAWLAVAVTVARSQRQFER